ncbi:unnamed protein product, partial [Symbiodinium sp. KB8]
VHLRNEHLSRCLDEVQDDITRIAHRMKAARRERERGRAATSAAASRLFTDKPATSKAPETLFRAAASSRKYCATPPRATSAGVKTPIRKSGSAGDSPRCARAAQEGFRFGGWQPPAKAVQADRVSRPHQVLQDSVRAQLSALRHESKADQKAAVKRKAKTPRLQFSSSYSRRKIRCWGSRGSSPEVGSRRPRRESICCSFTQDTAYFWLLLLNTNFRKPCLVIARAVHTVANVASHLGQLLKCRHGPMRAGAPDPWALQEAILKEERLFDDHLTKIQAGEDVRRTARMNPKELKYMHKTASVPSFRSTLTVRDRTFLREFHERPQKAQRLDVYAPYAAIFEEPVDTEYRRSPRQDCFTVRSLLKWGKFCKVAMDGRQAACTQLLRSVQRSKVQATLFQYNAAIAACKHGGAWTTALHILAQLASEGVVASSASHAAAIRACTQTRHHWKWAMEMLLSMKARSMQHNGIVASTGLTASARAESWLSVLDLFTRMAQEKLEQDAISYTAVVSGLEPLGRWKQSLELLQQISGADIVAYGAVIGACAKAGEWQMAVALLSGLSARGTLNEICVNSAITACERAGSWAMALVLLSGMAKQDLRPDNISVSAAISACARSGQWQAALALYEGMAASLLQLNVIPVNAAMHACEKAKKWAVVLQLLWAMPQQRLQHDGISLGSTRMACDGAEQWQWSLQVVGNNPTGGVEDGTLQNLVRRLAQQPSLLPEDVQLLRSACGPASTARAKPQEIVLLVWCLSSVGFAEKAVLSPLLTMSRELLSQGRLTWRELGHLAWALANLEVWDLDLALALQKEMMKQLADMVASCERGTWSSSMQLDCSSSALTAAWACNYLGCLQSRMWVATARALRFASVAMARQPATRISGLLPSASSRELLVPLESEELLVVCKPPYWSVDSGETERNSVGSLGAYLEAQYPPRQFPVLGDLAATRGFLHRLDVPSSGLILVAKTHRAYFDLQLQLQAPCFESTWQCVTVGCRAEELVCALECTSGAMVNWISARCHHLAKWLAQGSKSRATSWRQWLLAVSFLSAW